ncbi:MAG: PTS sugar transporter subunit IIA [Candidatus Desulfatibia sp.]|jgi:PTS system nitrogen regulatory IIA component|uniref:PTS sugar transporter subunit IIA n=1 Tax=Candidatus Desulfatibia sp. TaxID=3101189 RepID=UPI002F30CCDF
MKLSIKEVAKCLQLPLSTVERWIRQGRIPIQKSGNNLIFNDSAIEKWAEVHNLPFTKPQKDKAPQEGSRLENLLPVMKRGGVLHNVKGSDVPAVLQYAVNKMPALSASVKIRLYERLLERENLTSTGIGKGVALPHPHDPLADIIEKPLIATCFLEKPIDFAAIDDKPVFVMFILLSPTIKIHLHLLSRLSYCVRDNAFVEFLKTSSDSDAFFSKIADFEKQLDKADHY